jgi:uncharacterized protein YbcV (DUF1398 family)
MIKLWMVAWRLYYSNVEKKKWKLYFVWMASVIYSSCWKNYCLISRMSHNKIIKLHTVHKQVCIS